MNSTLPSVVNNSVISISSLNRLVRDCLESAFPLTWVSGEISNLTYAASGHVYFSLKDASAQARCVMWRSRAQLLGWRLENGQKVEARVLVSFYEVRGDFQLSVEALRRAGQGDLYERFLKLKAQLENEGIFAVDRKRALPAFPRHLAIVTSPQAAALRDVLSTLRRRAPHVRLTLIPTPVQGEGAAERIAAALAAADQCEAEAIILCRGGGSIEDLWAFNEACVARAIRACRVPVISGVGHETDFTIADFAADVRAPTPTAAAELACPEQEAQNSRLMQLARRLQHNCERRIAGQQQQLDWLAVRLLHPAAQLERRRQQLQQQQRQLQLTAGHQLERCQHRLDQLALRLHRLRPEIARQSEKLGGIDFRLANAHGKLIAWKKSRLANLQASLSQLNPHAILGRGYALATDSRGQIVRQASNLSPGEHLTLNFAHGKASVTVDKVVATGEAD